MNGRKLAVKYLAFTVCAAMLLLLAACGGSTSDTAASTAASTSTAESPTAAETTEKAITPITLTFLSPETGTGEWNNLKDSPIQKEIAGVTGVTLSVVEADDAKFKVILAGGDLPDLIRTNTSYHKQLIEGGNVIPLDDLLGTNGENIVKNVPTMLKFSKSQWSNGSDKTYFLAPMVTTKNGVTEFQLGIGFTIRWDYYKEIGAPVLKSQDDALNALAAMVEKHPKTDDGKKVYGVSAWTDWGGWQYMFSFLGFNGVRWMGPSTSIGYNMSNNQITNFLMEPDSAFWKSVEFYYKANKLGILDPDSLTQKFGDYTAKATAGQLLSTPSSWSIGDFNANNTTNGKGFMVIPIENGLAWYDGPVDIGWTDRTIGITKNCKNPDRAMDFLNYCFSTEGALTLSNGVKGQQWDMVDGKPKLNEATLKLKTAGGDTYKNTVGWITFNQALAGLNGISPEYGVPFDLSKDPSAYEASNNALTSSFNETYSVKYPGEIFAKKVADGTMKNTKDQWTVEEGILPAPPDDIKRIEAKLLDLYQKAAAKCILAKSDSEYNTIKSQSMEDFKAAGVDQVFAYYSKAWDDAHTTVLSVK